MLSEREVVALLNAHRRDSLGIDDGDLSNERAEALDRYHGRPYGNEKEGRSAVVARDLSETIDWVLPAILKVFLQGGNIMEFEPVGQEDEEAAKQETDYTNHVIMKDNNGFIILHDWVKESLLLKNGYVKYWWDDSDNSTESEYEGLTEDQLAKLYYDLQYDGEVDIKEQDQRTETVMLEGQEIQIPVFDVKFTCKKKVNRLKIEPVPVEEVRVSKRCRGSLQESPFTEHETTKTRSELIEMGMDKEFVYSLPALDEEENDSIRYSRDSVDDESEDYGAEIIDRSMDEVRYREAYIKIDYDEDGIAELRKIVTVSDQIPEGPEWNEVIDAVPMVSMSPKRVPHRHVGESLHDELEDLLEIKTTLTRQMLDNIYLTNNNQWLVNKRVNLQDFLKSTPGGVKRINDNEPVSGSAEPIMTPTILDRILPAIDYIDGVKENRTGINKTTTGMDPDAMKQSTKGAYLENLNRASTKVEGIIRMLTETGLRELILNVHQTLRKYQDVERMIKLRGEFVPVNPQQWKERTDLTAKVGLGTGNEEEKREKLLIMSQLQDKLTQMGMVGPQQAYNMFTDIAETLGASAPSQYVMDPNSQEFQAMQQNQSQPNPMAEAEQVKGQFELEKQKMKIEFDSQIEQLRQQMQYQQRLDEQQAKLMNDAADRASKEAMAEADRQSKEAIEAMKEEIKAMIEGFKVDLGRQGISAGVQDEG